MDNLNLLYNKLYYAHIHESPSQHEACVKDCNTRLFAAGFVEDASHSQLMNRLASHRFILETAYPGLLIGLGAAHNAGISSEEIALGFSFDYVTGLPYIPGSTIKGALRSFFKDYPQAAAEVIGIGISELKALENDIFNGNDIFFDATVYDSDAYGRLLGPEYITPHNCLTDNPVPIAMVKVLPGVRFQFRFQLHDAIGITAEKKQKLFAEVLCMMGIGAKTNVGFGILIPDSKNGAKAPKKTVPTDCMHSNAPRRPVSTGNFPNATQRAANSKEVIKKICPHCQTIVFKYRRNTTEVNWNWEKNICHKCRRPLE